MWLSEDHGRLIKWHPLVNFQFIKPFEKSFLKGLFLFIWIFANYKIKPKLH